MRFKIGIIGIFLILVNILNAKVIAKIPEASGICFIKKSNSLVVVNDEGWIYELSIDGKIKRKKKLGKYDLEGVDYDKKSKKLVIVVEGKESLLFVNLDNFKIEKEIKIKRSYKKINILKKSKGNGLEAIAMEDGDIYVSNQSKIKDKKKLKENASAILRVSGINKKKMKIKEVFNHGYIDIAGITFHNGFLYMVSDTKNLLIKYSLEKNKTISKIKLPSSAQEGICFDKNGYMYIADDNGKILRYKEKNYKL